MQRAKFVAAFPPALLKLTDALGILGLVFITVYYLTAFHFGTLITDVRRQVDFDQLYRLTWSTFTDARYPPDIPFPYPPSAIVMLLPIHLLPQTAAFILWIVLQAACLWIVVWSALKLSRAEKWPGRWALGCVGVLFTDYAVSWDLRNHSNNFIVLGLVMLAVTTRRTWVSALLLAVSSGLKIYSSVLVLVFALRREWRLALLTLSLMLAVWIALPMIAFGPDRFAQVLHDWALQVQFTASLEGYNFGEHITTLRRAFATLLKADASSGQVILLWRGTQILWTLLIIGYFVLASRARVAEAGKETVAGADISRLADVCIGMLAPLPLSTWLEPYHAVVTLPGYILLLTALFRDEWPASVQILSAGALSGSMVVQIANIGLLEARGLTFLMCFSFILIGLAAVRNASGRFPIYDA